MQSLWGCSSVGRSKLLCNATGSVKRDAVLKSLWGCSSVGRASALQAEGRQFESDQLHHKFLGLIQNSPKGGEYIW